VSQLLSVKISFTLQNWWNYSVKCEWAPSCQLNISWGLGDVIQFYINQHESLSAILCWPDWHPHLEIVLLVLCTTTVIEGHGDGKWQCSNMWEFVRRKTFTTNKYLYTCILNFVFSVVLGQSHWNTIHTKVITTTNQMTSSYKILYNIFSGYENLVWVTLKIKITIPFPVCSFQMHQT
jgi:hypothetical protein